MEAPSRSPTLWVARLLSPIPAAIFRPNTRTSRSATQRSAAQPMPTRSNTRAAKTTVPAYTTIVRDTTAPSTSGLFRKTRSGMAVGSTSTRMRATTRSTSVTASASSRCTCRDRAFPATRRGSRIFRPVRPIRSRHPFRHHPVHHPLRARRISQGQIRLQGTVVGR